MKFILSLCFLLTSLPVVLAIGRDIISPHVSEQGIEYFVLLSDTVSLLFVINDRVFAK